MTMILGDTTSCIPLDQAKALNLPLLPQIIIFDQISYRDDTEIDSKTFMTKLLESPTLPKTAAPPPALYAPYFTQAQNNSEEVVIICPSAELSGTYRSAITAANENGIINIYVIDSKTIGGGLASMLLEAKQWANNGLSAKEIVINVNKMIAKEQNYFVVDTLEYLHKGGRIGGAQHLFGSMLQIKPILSLQDGKVQPVESQRTKKRAHARLIELIAKDFPGTDQGHLSIMHGDAFAEAQSIADQIKNTYNLLDVPIYELPPAFLVHAGPGVIAVSFFKS